MFNIQRAMVIQDQLAVTKIFSTNVQVEENARYVLTKISEFTQVKIQLYK